MSGVLRLGSIKICPVKLAGEVVIDSLTITPSATTQNITPTGNIGGYNPVNVLPVGSYIDNNIRPNNIKNGVSILGVTGTYTGGSSSEERAYCIPRTLDSNGKLEYAPWVNIDFSGVEYLEDSCLFQQFWEDTNIQSVDFSDLRVISGTQGLNGTFYKCSNLTSVDLSSLTTLSSYYAMSIAFTYTGLSGILDLSSLTTVSGEAALNMAFAYTNITGVDFSSLTTISGYGAARSIFSGCTNLVSISFPVLSVFTAYECFKSGFRGCTSLTSMSFPALTTNSFRSTYEVTSQFNDMLVGVTGCTVHFPSNLQTKLSAWSSVQNGFGGTNTSILFDLPATS